MRYIKLRQKVLEWVTTWLEWVAVIVFAAFVASAVGVEMVRVGFASEEAKNNPVYRMAVRSEAEYIANLVGCNYILGRTPNPVVLGHKRGEYNYLKRVYDSSGVDKLGSFPEFPANVSMTLSSYMEPVARQCKKDFLI